MIYNKQNDLHEEENQRTEKYKKNCCRILDGVINRFQFVDCHHITENGNEERKSHAQLMMSK